MTVAFPSSSSAHVPSAAGKQAEVQALRETFAALLRSYGTEKSGMQTNTLLEIAPSSNAENNDRQQQRKDDQQRNVRNDWTQSDQKLLNKSEIRNSEMNADYQNRLDRQGMLQHDYRERTERSDLPATAVRAHTSSSALSDSPSSSVAGLSESLPNGNPSLPQQRNVAESAGINHPQSHAANIVSPNAAAGNTQANAVMPMNLNASVPLPIPVASQAAYSPALTIFTPLGRFGQLQEKAEDEAKENEDEESETETVGEKTGKKGQPFADFEIIRSDTMRSLRPRQPKEPVAQSEIQQIVEKPQAKPKEVEPEQMRNVKTVEEFLNTADQNISAQKKGESNQPDPTRYLNRIAAAYEAAMEHAAKNSPIRMKINLDHLGTLALHFFHKADRLALRFETPSKESARFLREHLDGLKTILAGRNVKIVDIEITL